MSHEPVLKIDTWKNFDCTIGRLYWPGFSCFTLELPWRDNQKNVSCYPAGRYRAVKYDSPKHGDVILLLDVPNREMCEIHAGNYTRQIEGCTLVGDSIKYLDGDQIPDVTNSKRTLGELLDLLPDEFFIEVTRK